MKRQVYYLLPDIAHTREIYNDLIHMDIPENHIHVVTKDKTPIAGVKDVHSLKEKDRDYLIEWFLWRLNLAVFGVSLFTLIGMAIWQISSFLLIPPVFMTVTFFTGFYFSLRVPNTHWNEFFSSLSHGEVLVAVDVQESAIQQIDHAIHRQHPEAINGGVCWKF